jgi:hypothetical protein
MNLELGTLILMVFLVGFRLGVYVTKRNHRRSLGESKDSDRKENQ